MSERLRSLIRAIPDFPIPGILFRDITPLLGDPDALKESVRLMVEPWRGRGIAKIAAMEARGFMFGAPMALELGAGFIPVRKPGKLPAATEEVTYELEYRTDVLQVHRDAVTPGEKVLVVDDVIATGGTAAAVVELMERLGGDVVGASFLIELSDLNGRQHFEGREVRSVITF